MANRDESTGLYLPPGYVPDTPTQIPPSGCEYCDEALNKRKEPSICGDCHSILWRMRIPQVGIRFCHHEGHNFITRVDGKRGHQAAVEIHTKEQCRKRQLLREVSI